MNGDAGVIALTARFAVAPATWTLITALSVITVSLRADLRALVGVQAVVYVALSVAVVPVVMLLAQAVLRVVRLGPRTLVIVALGLWVGAGAGRILVESALASAWGLPDLTLGWHVYVAQLVSLPLWAAVIGYSRALNVELAITVARRNHLVERLRMSTAERWNELAAQREILAKHVADAIRPQIQHIRELLARMDETSRSADLSAELQQVAEQSRELVRRASRETADLAQRRFDLEKDPEGGSRTVLRGFLPVSSSTSALAASVRATVLALVVTMLPLALAAGGVTWWLTCAALITTVAINTAGWSVVGRWLGRLPTVAAWAVVLLINFASPLLGYVIVTAVMRNLLGTTFLPRFAVAATSMMVLAGIVITLSQIWARDWYALRTSAISIEALSRRLEDLDASTQVEYERVCHQTARLLHGPIQGRLAAVAMSLGLGSESGRGVPADTLASCRGLVDSCLSDLDVLMQADGSLPPLDVSLRDLRRRWAGLLDIRWDIDPSIVRLVDGDPVLRSQVADFIGDCATNASRHGAARSLDLRAELGPTGSVLLRATDDGVGPTSPIVVGSGLGAFGVLGEDWFISRGPDGGCVIECALRRKASPADAVAATP